jgi:hypothetical protein
VSDDATQCPASASSSGCASCTCKDVCEPGEYGAACDGVASGAAPSLSAPGCRSAGISPGGLAYYCCACGADDGGS